MQYAVAMSSEHELIDALVQSAFATMAVLTKVAADHELSLTQLRVLAILSDRRVRMAELAGHLGLEKSTMSGLVDRAEKRGLLTRAPSASDGRAIDVGLTAAGDRVAGQIFAAVRSALAPMTQALTGPDQRRLQVLLERAFDVR